MEKSLSKPYQVADKTFVYSAYSFSNSRSWRHICQLYCNNNLVADTKIIYYNRTWEYYQYQSVIHKAIDQYYNQLQQETLDTYKQQHNRKALRQAEKQQLTQHLQQERENLITQIDQSHRYGY